MNNDDGEDCRRRCRGGRMIGEDVVVERERMCGM